MCSLEFQREGHKKWHKCNGAVSDMEVGGIAAGMALPYVGVMEQEQ